MASSCSTLQLLSVYSVLKVFLETMLNGDQFKLGSVRQDKKVFQEPTHFQDILYPSAAIS